jgi:hypothetical protein
MVDSKIVTYENIPALSILQFFVNVLGHARVNRILKCRLFIRNYE